MGSWPQHFLIALTPFTDTLPGLFLLFAYLVFLLSFLSVGRAYGFITLYQFISLHHSSPPEG